MKRLLLVLFLLVGCGSDTYHTVYFPMEPPPASEWWQEVHYAQVESSWVSTWVDWELREEKMLAVPPKFLQESRKGSNRPFALLSVFTRGVSDEATSEADWGANVGELNVDYTSLPPQSGDVILEQDEAGTPVEIPPFFPTEDSADSVGGAVFPASPPTFFDKVDEDPNDGDSTYAYYNSPGGFRTFVFSATNILVSELENMETIYSVKVVTYARGTVGSEPLRQGLVVNGSLYTGSLHNVTTGYLKYENEWTQNPDTVSAWTRTNLLDLTSFGFSSNLAGGQIRVTNCYIIVTYRPFETSGYIEVELDLTGANTDNEAIISIDEVTPAGAGLTHELFYPTGTTGYMRPVGHYDVASGTINEVNAYNGNDADASTTDLAVSGPGFNSFYIGRDSGNTDQWGARPDFVSGATLSLKCIIEKDAMGAGGEAGAKVTESDGTLIAWLVPNDNTGVSKATFSVDVTSYTNDLEDLRIHVVSNGIDAAGDSLYIYDTWIEGEVWGDEVAIVDGSRVPTLGAELFKTKSSFTSDGTATSVLKSIAIEIPDRVYRFTDLDSSKSFLDALPLIEDIPGRTIEIDLKSYLTKSSDLNVGLQRYDKVDELLRGEYARGLAAEIWQGYWYDGVSEADLVPYYQGKIEDWSVGLDSVSLTLSDASKDLTKKWPIPIGSIVPAKTYDGIHFVDIIKEITDELGIAGRYLNGGSMDEVKASVGANRLAYRGVTPPVASGDTTITDPKPAKEYITELLYLLGAIMPTQEDGKLTLIEYDATTPSIDDWDRNVFGDSPWYVSGMKDLTNILDVYYDWNGSGDEAGNYSGVYVVENIGSTSADAWDDDVRKVVKSNWLAGSTSDGYYGEETALAVGTREANRLGDGLGVFTCDTKLDKVFVQVGDFITIDSDLLLKANIGRGSTQKFIVAKKVWDLKKIRLRWTLVEAR